jgi:hypothetical protein
VDEQPHHDQAERAAYHRCVGGDGLHLDRARAGAFGAIARRYGRDRPPYPDALINDLAALARRGLAVLGIEADERMAVGATPLR